MDGNNLIEIESEALAILDELKAVTVINDQLSYDAAVAMRVQAKERLKRLDEAFDPIKDSAFRHWKSVCAQKDSYTKPINDLLKVINTSLINWDAEQERLRREEQARLEAEARKAEEDKRLEEAAQMQAAGIDEQSIDAHIAAPVVVTQVQVAAPTYQKSAAVVLKNNYSAQVDDLWLLVKAVAKDKAKLNLLLPNLPALNKMAKALEENLNLPGVRAVNNKIAASGRG